MAGSADAVGLAVVVELDLEHAAATALAEVVRSGFGPADVALAVGCYVVEAGALGLSSADLP